MHIQVQVDRNLLYSISNRTYKFFSKYDKRTSLRTLQILNQMFLMFFSFVIQFICFIKLVLFMHLRVRISCINFVQFSSKFSYFFPKLKKNFALQLYKFIVLNSELCHLIRLIYSNYLLNLKKNFSKSGKRCLLEKLIQTVTSLMKLYHIVY